MSFPALCRPPRLHTSRFPVQELTSLVEAGRLDYDVYIVLLRAALRSDVAIARVCRDRGFAAAFRVALARARTTKAEIDEALGKSVGGSGAA